MQPVDADGWLSRRAPRMRAGFAHSHVARRSVHAHVRAAKIKAGYGREKNRMCFVLSTQLGSFAVN